MENLIYETRCRKCDSIIEFSGRDSDTPTLAQTIRFEQLMYIYLREPPLFPCPKCGIFTIQEIVSHTRVVAEQEPELTDQQKDLIERCNKTQNKHLRDAIE